MESAAELLREAEGAEEEMARIEEIKKECGRIEREIEDLVVREKELRGVPDKVSVYKNRLEKVRVEIEKQEVLEMEVKDIEGLKKVENVLTKKQVFGKVFEYLLRLHREKEVRVGVGQVKVRAYCFYVSLEYNELVEHCRLRYPEDLQLVFSPITDPIVKIISSGGNVLSGVGRGRFVVFSYALSRRVEIDEEEVFERVVEALEAEKSREGGADGASGSGDEKEEEMQAEKRCAVKRAPLHGTLPSLAVHEEILQGVKKFVTKDLLKISPKALREYNEEIFYGTVYHIDNIDTWMCDNLISQMPAGRAECTELSEEEEREVQQKNAVGAGVLGNALYRSMEEQEVKTVSKELYKIFRIIRSVSKTERSQTEKIREAVRERVRRHFEPAEDKDHASTKTRCIRLCDAKVMMGVILGLPKGVQAESDGECREKTEGDGQGEEEDGVKKYFAEDEEFYAETMERLFSELVWHSGYRTVRLTEKNAESFLETVLTAFTSQICKFFKGNFLSHIKAEFFNAICRKVYETLCSDELFCRPVASWEKILHILLAHSEELQHALNLHRELLSLYQMMKDFKNKGTLFLDAYNKNRIELPEEVIIHIVPVIFTDKRAQSTVISHIEKRQKSD